jgi:putative hydrolase of the HAD superfamily
MRMVCFDLDDTLVSEREYVESGLRAAGDRIDELVGAGASGSGGWLVEEWRRARGRDLFQRRLHSLGADPGWLPDVVRAYRDHEPVISPREGAREVLEALVRRGDRISLISDGHRETQRRKWRASGLSAHPFEPVVFTDERGRDHWKPHPWSFEAVMRAAPDVSAFVYVADNDEKDFLAPNRLGWVTVQLLHPDNLRPAGAAHGDARAQRQIVRLRSLLEIA